MLQSFQLVSVFDFPKMASQIIFINPNFAITFNISGECIPPRTISVAASAFNLILTIANLDLNAFQVSKLIKFFSTKKLATLFCWRCIHNIKNIYQEKKWQQINGDTRHHTYKYKTLNYWTAGYWFCWHFIKIINPIYLSWVTFRTHDWAINVACSFWRKKITFRISKLTNWKEHINWLKFMFAKLYNN